MEHFFRHTPDPKANISMAKVWLILIIYLLVIYRFREKKKLLELQLIFIAIVEVSLIIWYYKGKDIFFVEGLPLYHCRIAGFMMPIAYFTKRYKLLNYFSYLGIIGPLVAYTVPDPSKYMWPHITNVTYICAHTMLIASGLMVVSSLRRDLDLKYISKVTLLMNLIIYIANKIFAANYGYLATLPESMSINVPSILLLFAMSFLIIIAIYFLNHLFKKLSNKKVI